MSETPLSPHAKALGSLLSAMAAGTPADIGTLALLAVSAGAKRYAETATDPIACRRGCSHCCRMMVGVSTAEAVSLYWALVNGTPEPGLSALRADLHAKAVRVRGLDQKGYWEQETTGCVFLTEDQACGIYAMRPRACAAHMVSDVTPCREHDGQVKTHLPPRDVSNLAYIAISKELRRRGLQSGLFELNYALDVLFSDETAAERWAAGEQVFFGNLATELDDHIHLKLSD